MPLNLFDENSFKQAIEFVKPAVVTFDDKEYTFVCPNCSKAHTMVCMAEKGDPLILMTAVGRAISGGFATAGLESKTGNLIAKIGAPYNAQLLAVVCCTHTTDKDIAKELDKRGDVLEGYRSITKALLDHYEPSSITTLGRHSYEIVTGRSIPDTSIYGAFSYVQDIPVQALPAPVFEMQAPFRKKRFEKALEKSLNSRPKRVDTTDIKLNKVVSNQDALEAVTALRAGRFLYFDVEFAGNPYKDNFLLLCLAAKCPSSNDVYLWEEAALKNPETNKLLIELLADPSVKKGAHNAKAEWLACTQFFPGLKHCNGRTKMKNLYADSMLLVYLLGLGGQVRLSTCSEYVGLGGQKSDVEAAVSGQGSLVRDLKKAVKNGESLATALLTYRNRIKAKLSRLRKPGLVATLRSEGNALKVARLLADTIIQETSEGADTPLWREWQGLLVTHGNPVYSELLSRAVEDVHSEPERYAYGLIDREMLGIYCARDVFTGCEVAVWAGSQVVKTPGLKETWFDIVAPATEVISQMERNGVPAEYSRLTEVIERVQQDMNDCEAKLKDLGFDGDISKPADVGYFLFNKLGMTPEVFTEKGNKPSVSKDALDALLEQSPDSPVISLLKKYNTASKVNDSFGETLRQKIAADGCIHGTFNSDGTKTGRLSCSDPNLQQLPSHSEYAKDIKGAFVGRINGAPGVLVQLDFSQIELRVAAALSGDPLMIAAFASGQDFHKATAQLVWGKPGYEVTKEQRSDAKKINFGLLYNKSVRSLAEDLLKTIEQTQSIKDAIMSKYKVLDAHLRYWEKFAETNGYARTYWWDNEVDKWMPRRIRHLHDIKHVLGGFASKAKNGSVNTPIQGTSGDCTLVCLIRIDQWLQESGVEAKLVLTVHDSIALVCSFKDAFKVAVNCKRIMESINLNGVPVIADCELGLDYGHSYPLKDVIAGAGMLANGFPEEEAAQVAGILRDGRDFGILKNLAPDVQEYYKAA